MNYILFGFVQWFHNIVASKILSQYPLFSVLSSIWGIAKLQNLSIVQELAFCNRQAYHLLNYYSKQYLL